MLHRTIMPGIREYLLSHEDFNFSGTMELVYLKSAGHFYYYLLKDLTSQAYLLKVAAAAGVDSGLTTEYQVLRYLEQCPHTPNAYHFEARPKGLERDILLLEYIREDQEFDYAQDYLKVAQVFGTIHSYGAALELPVLADPLEQVLERAKAHLADALPSGVFRVDHLYFFDGFMEWAQENRVKKGRIFREVEPVICHGPLVMGDFHMNGPGYLYSWDQAYIGDAAMDITHFLARTTSLMEANVVLRAIDREDFYYRWEKAMGLERSSLTERVANYMPYYLLEFFSRLAKVYYEYAKAESTGLDQAHMEQLQHYLDIDFMQETLSEYI